MLYKVLVIGVDGFDSDDYLPFEFGDQGLEAVGDDFRGEDEEGLSGWGYLGYERDDGGGDGDVDKEVAFFHFETKSFR